MTVTIYEGHWAEALTDGMTCDLLISDLTQPIWGDVCILEFVEHWSPRTRGWILAFAVDEEIMVWRAAYHGVGRDDLRAIPCVPPDPHGRTIYLMAGRPRTDEYRGWATPSWYRRTSSGLSIELLRTVVGDFSRPAERVIDPCAGRGDALIAAAYGGRSALGAERDRDAFIEAKARIAGQPAGEPGQMTLFSSNQ